ncbi:MAG: YggT family protein [Candidatus Izemoplasmatales bacterium]|nr:YggT family protein [Candidatus Izemoplasmatales bacterium]
MTDYLYLFLRYVYWVLSGYFYLMIITLILSWTPLRSSRFYDFLDKIASLYLRYFRGWAVVGGTIDLSPMIGLLLYQLLLSFIASALR